MRYDGDRHHGRDDGYPRFSRPASALAREGDRLSEEDNARCETTRLRDAFASRWAPTSTALRTFPAPHYGCNAIPQTLNFFCSAAPAFSQPSNAPKGGRPMKPYYPARDGHPSMFDFDDNARAATIERDLPTATTSCGVLHDVPPVRRALSSSRDQAGDAEHSGPSGPRMPDAREKPRPRRPRIQSGDIRPRALSLSPSR
jgi:hypothetical protein